MPSAVLGFAASEASGRFRGLNRTEVDDDFEVLLQMLLAGLAVLGRGTTGQRGRPRR
jgi:hypothetical protein